MRSPKINICFTGYGDSGLLNKANHIVASMTISGAFVTPVPTLAEVQNAIDAYSASLVAAAALGRVNVATKDQNRETLELLLAQLGRYVMYIAAGDYNILVNSGFTVSKDPQPRYLQNPGNVVLGNGITTGTMTSTIKRGNATSYVHEITDVLPTENTVWIKYPSSTAQFVFTNLTPGKQYWVRVAAIGYRNQVAYSNIASQFAQ